LELRGKRLVWKPGQKRRRPILRASVERDETSVESPEELRVSTSVQRTTAEDHDPPRQHSTRRNRAQAGIPAMPHGGGRMLLVASQD
jgi:hypothetical protein